MLTAAEQQLVKAVPPDKGRDLLKQVRTQLIEAARPVLQRMLEAITGTGVLSMHHDISTVTGEEVVAFALAESPAPREARDVLFLGPPGVGKSFLAQALDPPASLFSVRPGGGGGPGEWATRMPIRT